MAIDFATLASQLTGKYLYYLIAITALVLIVFIFIIVKVKKSLRGNKDREIIFDEITGITKEKASIKAQESVIDEAMKYGKISQYEYNSRKAKYQKKAKELDDEIDKRVDLLGTIYFQHHFEKEAKKDSKKVNYLVDLQQGQGSMKQEIFKLNEERNQAVKDLQKKQAEVDDLKEQLNNFEEQAKKKILTLETEMDRKLKSPSNSKEPTINNTENTNEKVEEYFHKNLLYGLLVSRYNQFITEKETKTVDDLKAMVQPRNTHIAEISERITNEIPEYDSSKYILKACEKAYEIVSDEIHSVPSIGINFWMSIKEILENKVADYEDKAIFLCSLFKALGAESWVIITELTGGSNRPLVLMKVNSDNFLLCDPNRKHDFTEFAGPKKEVIKQYSFAGEKIKKVVYEFNDIEYIEGE